LVLASQRGRSSARGES